MRRWRSVAAVAFGLAIAVKFLPIVLLPLYWKRVRVRDVVLTTAIVALLYVPFLNHGRIPIGSLGTYVQSFRFNDPVFATLERIMSPQVAFAFAALCGFLTAIWTRKKKIRGIMFRRICVADGRNAFVCASHLPLVSALDASVPANPIHGADHHLDGQHNSHLLSVVFAGAWPSCHYPAGLWRLNTASWQSPPRLFCFATFANALWSMCDV